MTAITMLNSMASHDLRESLDVQQSWGMDHLDLKDHIFGQTIVEITRETAQTIADLANARGQRIGCLTTEIFKTGFELGEDAFYEKNFHLLEHMLELATTLKADTVRVLSPRLPERSLITDSVEYLERHHPWIFEVYQKAADLCNEAGISLTVENEPEGSIFSNASEILRFYEKINLEKKIYFTYDVQNLWQMGTFPSLEVLGIIKPVMKYYHVKGGIMDGSTKKLKWKSLLKDASWPVEEMTKQVVLDGNVAQICLNPSHGGPMPGYDYANWVKRDLDYLRQIIAEVRSF